MEKLVRTLLLAPTLLLGTAPATAGDYDWADIWGEYTRRIDRAMPSSGNAQDVNTSVHVIDPWPPYAHDRYLPGNGQRAVGAIERYHHPRASAASSSQPQAAGPAPTGSQPDGSSNTGNGQNSTSGK